MFINQIIMKQIIFIIILAVASITLVSALVQEKKPVQLNGLLEPYLSLKNALVSGNSTKTAEDAAVLVQKFRSVDSKGLNKNDQSLFHTLLAGITTRAQEIQSTKDLNKQRASFGALAANMINLARDLKLTDNILYVDYCPMKKQYWLSEEKNIRNPFYGNSMLTCGSVKETIGN